MPIGPATRLQGTAVNSTALQLSWQPPSSDQLNGILRLYTVSLHEDLTGQTTVYNTTASRLMVGSLIPCSTYSWSVMPYTIGYGPVSSGSYSVTTLPKINGMFSTVQGITCNNTVGKRNCNACYIDVVSAFLSHAWTTIGILLQMQYG